MLVDESGAETRLGHPWYSGWANVERWTLKPEQTAILPAIALGIAADNEAAKKFEDPIGSVIVGPPGKYRLRYELRFNAWERRDRDGKKVIPGDGDWQGTLSTGITTLRVRSRRPEKEPPRSAARRQADREHGAEQERHTEARRAALRAEIERATKQGDHAAAGRHWVALISLPDPPLRDCRPAIRELEASQDWQSLATVLEATAKAMQAIIVAPPERFTRPVPPPPPERPGGGPTVEVQTDLDGRLAQGQRHGGELV
jgi:hypothetical protein